MPISLGLSSDRGQAAGGAPAARDEVRAIDSSVAPVLLANLGFLLVPGPPLDHGAAYLLVAVRPRPTLAHFDPERIEYWSFHEGRAVEAELEWPLPRIACVYAWGTISITDRVGAVNRFVSFGGDLAVSRDSEIHAALFRSTAPILSLGGRSGPADPLAAQSAGFQATLRGAAGYDSPVRALSETLAPVALYSAFVLRTLDLYRDPDAATVSPHLVSLLRAEVHRLETSDPAELESGRDLAERLRAPQPV